MSRTPGCDSGDGTGTDGGLAGDRDTGGNDGGDRDAAGNSADDTATAGNSAGDIVAGNSGGDTDVAGNSGGDTDVAGKSGVDSVAGNSGGDTDVAGGNFFLAEYFDRYRLATAAFAVLAAVVAVLVASRVFPYYSLNHDEGVYLQQAALLLDGGIFLQPPVDGPFRPWFFVESDRGLYSKYAPLPAAVFALGKLAGGYVVALAGVAGAVVALTVGLGRELYDAHTGLLGGAFLLVSPLFLVQSGVYLPYATTTALNLTFALAYFRAERQGSTRLAAVAGAAIGLAFFARPYTALLFATPFIGHAVWTLVGARPWRAVTTQGVGGGSAEFDDRALLTRRALTAAVGTLGVLATLGYNALVTGDPFLFPYQAFAPADDVGFGHRQILGHEAEYTPSLALRSNAQVLRRLFTDWVVAGSLGSALAVVGVGGLVRSQLPTRFGGTNATIPDELTTRRTLLAGLFVSVAAGNVAFWGNYNVLGSLAVETDGLIHYLGPYYHYDLLVPTAVFAARGALLVQGRLGALVDRNFDADRARRIGLATVLVGGLLVGGAAATTAADPLERNYAVSGELEQGYEPFLQGESFVAGEQSVEGEPSVEGGPPTDAVVFLPPVYGPWLNHPFQALRNDPGFDGARVYALDGYNALDVAAAFPDRELYRYVYTGTWTPVDESSVDAELRDVERVAGESIRVDATLGIPDRARSVTIRVATDEAETSVAVEEPTETLSLTMTATEDHLTVAGDGLAGTEQVRLADRDEVVLEVFVETGTSSGFSYRLTFPVASDGSEVGALSPTEEWCRVPTECDPVGLAETDEGVFVETSIESDDESG